MMSAEKKTQKTLFGGCVVRGIRLPVAVAVGLALIIPLMPSQVLANPDDPWWSKSRDLTLQERRARRQQFKDAFTARLGPEYETNIPFVSQQSIDGLSQAIERYRQIVSNGGWRPLSGKGIIRPNDFGKHIYELRSHLALTGDLRTKSRRPRGYDASLQDAVARYQLRHGLRVTGFVGSRTRRALNIPADVRLRQLETNLVRLQDLMRVNKAKRYVLVNIPAYKLQAVDSGTVALQSKVVVGKPTTKTNLLTARIKGLNFYPYWRVPDSIARRDLIPQIRKDPTYFDKLDFRLLPTWGAKPIPPEQIDWSSPDVFKRKFRQEPGPGNALGVLRINMPNKHILYLHDTPLKQLFNQNTRAFSAGCVRVKRVLDLAAWLVNDVKGWTPLRIETTVALGQSENVKLKKSVPVHFVYVTAWSTGNGIVQFRPDLYDRDNTGVKVAKIDASKIVGSRAIAP